MTSVQGHAVYEDSRLTCSMHCTLLVPQLCVIRVYIHSFIPDRTEAFIAVNQPLSVPLKFHAANWHRCLLTGVQSAIGDHWLPYTVVSTLQTFSCRAAHRRSMTYTLSRPAKGRHAVRIDVFAAYLKTLDAAISTKKIRKYDIIISYTLTYKTWPLRRPICKRTTVGVLKFQKDEMRWSKYYYTWLFKWLLDEQLNAWHWRCCIGHRS